MIQLISCTIGCIGYASWFKIRGKKILYSGVGAFLTWGIYLLVYAWYPNNFSAIVAASCFVAGYAFIMSRIDHAPSTVFLTASVFPLMPGARLYYLMYGVVSRNFSMAAEHARVLLETCLGIAFWIYYCRCDLKKYHAGDREKNITWGKSLQLLKKMKNKDCVTSIRMMQVNFPD